MKYRIKCFMGGELGWLYIVGNDGESPREFASLEEAKECLIAWEWYSTKLYSIVDENGNEIIE